MNKRILLFPKQQTFRLNKIENICTRKNKSLSKMEICFYRGRKNCWKRRQEDHDGPISLTLVLSSTG